MRLPPNYQSTITETANEIFGEKATVWLFGSRLDDNAKGSNVDLLIQLKARIHTILRPYQHLLNSNTASEPLNYDAIRDDYLAERYLQKL